MALDEAGFVVVCDFLHRAYPDDARVARLLIGGLVRLDRRDEARRVAVAAAKRFIALGRASLALGFLTRAQALGAGDEEVEHLMQAARLVDDADADDSGVRRFELIETLSDEEAERFLRQGTRRHVRAGQVILRQGEVGDSFAIILQGQCEVRMERGDQAQIVGTLAAGDFFGEVASLFKLPRSATVAARTDVEILEFTGDAVERLAKESPLAGEYLRRVVERRLLATMTYQVAGLHDLAETDREWIAEESAIVELPEGERMRADRLGDALWVVIHGELNFVRRVDGALRVLSWGAGRPFGNAIEGKLGVPEDADILATERTLLARIPKRIALALFAAYPSVDEWVRKAGDHLRETLGQK